ncbi:MAG: redox-regulated ATPase YchF [Chloroflexota bacterium]
MKFGIIGLPQSGKTTIFNAVTGGHTPTTASAGRIDVHTAVVDVPDERVDRLAEIFKPKKVVHAKVTYADIAGLEGGSAKSGIAGPLLNQLSQMDGFIQVVRCFPDPNIPHPSGSVDPARDISAMDSELLLNDLITVERKLERLTDERKKGGTDRAVNERQAALFTRLHETLSAEKPLRGLAFTPEEDKLLSGFGLLTRKPLLALLNLDEGQDAPVLDTSHPTFSIKGKLEMEIAQLPEEDAAIFMQEYGIDELSLRKMIRLSYSLLELQSFFTFNNDEMRAWALRRGATAHEAAGQVHTDMQRGFVRAEVVHCQDLFDLGSMAEARASGKLRLEGKEYIVQDGEIVHIRFNV